MQPALRPDDLVAHAGPQRTFPGWSWPLIALALIGTGYGSVFLTPPGSTLAMWWPATGIATCFVLRTARRRRLAALALVVASTMIANIVGGRDLALAIPFGLLNAIEIAIIVLLLEGRTSSFRLRSARDASLLLLAAAVGGSTAGLLAAATTALTQRAGFGDTLLYTTSSHIAAILLIAPFAVLPPRLTRRMPWAEIIVQSTLLLASVAIVFTPASLLPLSFVPFVFLVWGASRLPAVFAFAQALLVATAGLVLTILGSGPFFTSSLDAHQLALVVEVYMIVVAAFTIMLVSSRFEARAATHAATSASQLLRGGLIDSQVGLVIGEDRGGLLRIVWANHAAYRVLEAEVDGRGVWDGPLARNARVSMAEHVQTVHETPEGGGVISLLAHAIPDQPGRFSAQMVDVSASVRMTRAREAAERDRAAAQTTLIDLERQRNELVATTSHELRTPITSIAGDAELLQESSSLPDQERSWVAVIARNVQRLSGLVEDLLTLGSSPSDTQPRVVHSLALSELAAEAAAKHRPIAEAKHLSLNLEVDAGLVVHGVATDLVRVVGNLIANAVTFTPEGGTVHIRSGSEDGHIALRITDTGPGMPSDMLALSFDRFYRGPGAEQANAPGTGLGLPIAEQLMARHGGRVILDSQRGEGLTATIVFRETMPASEPSDDPRDGQSAPLA